MTVFYCNSLISNFIKHIPPTVWTQVLCYRWIKGVCFIWQRIKKLWLEAHVHMNSAPLIYLQPIFMTDIIFLTVCCPRLNFPDKLLKITNFIWKTPPVCTIYFLHFIWSYNFKAEASFLLPSFTAKMLLSSWTELHIAKHTV